MTILRSCGRYFGPLPFCLSVRDRFFLRARGGLFALLSYKSLRDSHRQRPYPRHHAHAFGHGDRTESMQDVEQVRTLQAEVVRREQSKMLFSAPESILFLLGQPSILF